MKAKSKATKQQNKVAARGSRAGVMGNVAEIRTAGERLDTVLRNRLTDLVAGLSPVELTAVISFIENMEDIEDAAYIAMHDDEDDEGAISLDELITKYGYTRSELEAEARAEGLIK